MPRNFVLCGARLAMKRLAVTSTAAAVARTAPRA
jgi:hypothetical protein